MDTRPRTPWQRLTLSLVGISILVMLWHWATNHLYSLPVTAISAFTTITINTLYVVGALVIFFVTGKLVYDWKNQTTTDLVNRLETTITAAPVAPKHLDNLNEIP